MFHGAMRCLLAACIGLQLVVLPVSADGSESPRLSAANTTEFLYQVLICQLETAPLCGGVVVARGIIITSATCVLKFGSILTFLEEAVLYGGGTSLLFDIGNVNDVMIHPQYTENPVTYDMALIKYIPEEKGPYLNSTVISRTFQNQDSTSCLMTSWWTAADSWPEKLMWQPVTPTQCSPQDPGIICFSDEALQFNKKDYGSPIVCENELVGLVPQGGGNEAINVTFNYVWLNNTIAALNTPKAPAEPSTTEDTRPYLLSILQKLDILTQNKSSGAIQSPGMIEDHLKSWNNQIVIPLTYVLFAMVVFFFVLLMFLVLFTVVLVYYGKK